MLEKITLVMDIDGTLCPIKTKEQEYADLVPYPDMVQRLREYKREGATIVLHTSRNMKTYNGNIGKINANTAKVLLAWLDKWEIPYDEIVYGKPWAGKRGLYVDDRTVRPDEFLRHSFEELEMMCKRTREGLER
jgi:capsule biosynthesis phosphatase